MEKFHVTTWGGSGPRVILVHGSAQGSPTGGDKHFIAQQRLADRGWQVLVPDRPGHGLSADPGRPDDPELDGELVAELIGDGAHLVGHSFGGCVALAAAVRHPERVHSLTLIEPAMPLLAMHKFVVLRFGLRIAFASAFPMPDITRIKRFMNVVNIPPELRGIDGTDGATLARMGRAISRLRIPDKAVLKRQLGLIRDAKTPVLAVAGSWSPAFRAITDSVAEEVNGRTQVIPSPHHFPHLVSDEFNQALAVFMTDSDTRRTSN